MDKKKPSGSELREQRLNELEDSCQNKKLCMRTYISFTLK